MDYYEADAFTTELVQDKEPQGVEVQLHAAGQALARELSAFSKSIAWSGINRFISDAVDAMTTDSLPSDHGPSVSNVVFDSKPDLSKDALVEERILHLMSSPALFLQLDSATPDWTAFEQFDEAFSVEENEEEITTLQERHPNLSMTMHALVPEVLTQEQAWARFFFLSAQIRLGRPVNLRHATTNEAPEEVADGRTQRQCIQLTSSFETVRVSESTRSVSQLSEASYDFVSRQHSPAHSTSNFSMPDDGL